jgi:hypothetical protein
MHLISIDGGKAVNRAIVFIMIAVVSISFLLSNTTLTAHAVVICVDKNNPTKVLACSDPNAVDRSIISASRSTKNTTTTAHAVSTTSAKIQLLFVRVEHIAGYIFTTHYVVWGKVANTGGTPSKPISVQIDCSSIKGAPLYTTTAPLRPAVLQPGDTGQFSQPVSSNDLQGTKYNFDCNAKPIEQK